MNLAQFIKDNPDLSSRTSIEDKCIICHTHTEKSERAHIPCKHVMHWKCLLESLNVTTLSEQKESCPYCRQPCGFNKRGFTNCGQKCEYIIKKGTRKGTKCGKNCHISGQNSCKSHSSKIIEID